ncbi:response regulator transcription factor [Lutimonas sp.]|uniref:response regulator transcription factor n=1 Tax=Lutimonas sp. TaxID=1872403 RepID=UPI003D9BBBC5
MKNKYSLELNNSCEARNTEALVKIAGLIDFKQAIGRNTEGIKVQNEGQFVLDVTDGSILNATGFTPLLGYSKKMSMLKDVVQICFKKHLPLLKHLFRTYIEYCESHFLAQSSTGLTFTCRVQKRNKSYIKILCQISVYESHENQLTKLLIKFSDIDFISSSCDMAWTLQSNKEQELVYKKMVSEKFRNLFSPRELEIASEMKKSHTNTEIGDKLFISAHTVATHRKNLFKKSGLHSTNELISYCRERGLI